MSIFIVLGSGLVSLLLKHQRVKGGITLVLGLVALALGGGGAVESSASFDEPVLGLDFLLIDLFALCVLFVPLERLLGKRQKILRDEWRIDLTHFAASHVTIGVMAALSIAPAHYLFSWLLEFEFRDWISSLNPALQFVLVVATVDFTNYWVHRSFHSFPLLWRFHAIHHSAREMDWLAGSRQHLGDVLITRMVGFVPVFVLGFSQGPVYAYVLLISFHAVFIHANVRIEFWWFDRILTSPKFHHWHHANEPDSINMNYAVLMPIWDDLFRTALRCKPWPSGYGLVDDTVPDSWSRQFTCPFSRIKASQKGTDTSIKIESSTES
ncbi:sterol desaturase family protein [Planctomycetota bacterium]|nr:sterol desaturase family protein [Planctomycetota bacterium]